MSASGGGGTMTNDQLKARYVGTGHADLSKYEFLTNQHRDTYASLISHADQLSYMAVSTNQSLARVKLEFLESMVQPCGPPPTTTAHKQSSNDTIVEE